MGRIFRRLKRLVRSEQSLDPDPARPGQNVDSMAAADSGPGRVDPHSGGGHSGAPPNYVPSADEGRTVENDDAWAQGGSGGDQFPPNYVRQDDGRPLH